MLHYMSITIKQRDLVNRHLFNHKYFMAFVQPLPRPLIRTDDRINDITYVFMSYNIIVIDF